MVSHLTLEKRITSNKMIVHKYPAVIIVSALVILSNYFSITSVETLYQPKVREKLVKTNDIALSTGHWLPSISTSNEQAYITINHDEQLTPVILLPGDGGSRLQAKLNRTTVEHHYCERHSADWFDLWVNLSLLVPFAVDCWVDK